MSNQEIKIATDEQYQQIMAELIKMQHLSSEINKNLNFLNKELKVAKTECISKQCQLDDIQNSFSWRITGPMRTAVQFLRKIKNRYRNIFKRFCAQHLFSKSSLDQKNIHDKLFSMVSLLPKLSNASLDDLLNCRLNEQYNKYDIVCYTISSWDSRYQRPQQILSQFALNGHRVFYIHPSEFLNPNGHKKISIHQIKNNVYQVTLAGPKKLKIYDAVITDKNKDLLATSLQALRKHFKIEHAISYVMLPCWYEVALTARNTWGWSIVYDCMDEWEDFPKIKQPLVDIEPMLVKQSNLVIVTAKTLYEKWQPYNQAILLARNAADYDFYQANYAPNNLLRNIKGPIIGFYGAIADWFDLKLAMHLAMSRPNYTFVYVGEVFDIDVTELKKLPNVILTGDQDYELMPKYLYHFDVCTIPFKINSITEATDPVKLYEYFCAGKPVVAVNLPEIKIYQQHLYLAANHDDFLLKLDAAVNEENSALITARKIIAKENAWTVRYLQINTAFKQTVPLVSIIVVSYNNLAYTKMCLDTVIKNTEYPNYEIIVVDNNSEDRTPAYLRYMASRFSNIRIILNDTNHGFAKANNQALAQSKAEYLVLLNNDTAVPPGWLDRLLWHLRDPKVGMVGPVTNQIGNEAKIAVQYSTIAEMIKFSQQYTWDHEGEIKDIPMLAMFCVAMRAEVYKKIGDLDEQFGIGMFEDDDYSHRIRQAGYRVICAHDAFIHHIGQGSFIKLIESGDYNPLFERNKKLFEQKWQMPWQPHSSALLTTQQSTVSRQLKAVDKISAEA